MRSELVLAAAKQWSNRYLLMQVASAATRKFHRPHSRIQETTNEVLMRLAESTNIDLPSKDASPINDRLCAASDQKAA